jgi:hypothetical protein
MINIETNYRFSQFILVKIDAVNAEDPACATEELHHRTFATNSGCGNGPIPQARAPKRSI